MNKLHFLLVLVSIIFYSCAKQSSPSGGPRDETPPEVLGAFPEKESTNFEEKTIRVLFDEFIQLNKPQQNIIISPPLNNVKYMARRKELAITLPDSLKKNTTYKINFGEAIQDLNEGNPLTNFAYVFATGPVLDSLTLSGKVVDAFTTEPKENIKVNLYESLEDSSIYNENPAYFATTDKNGRYAITNIREDTFYVAAYNDQNNNFRFDPKFEGIAFHPQPIYIDSNVSDILLRFSKPLSDFPKVKCTPAAPFTTLLTIDRQQLPGEKYSYQPQATYVDELSQDSLLLFYNDTTALHFTYNNFLKDTFTSRCQIDEKGKFTAFSKTYKNNTITIKLTGLIDSINAPPTVQIDTTASLIALDTFYDNVLKVETTKKASTISFKDSSLIDKNGFYLTGFNYSIPQNNKNKKTGTLSLTMGKENWEAIPKILYLIADGNQIKRYVPAGQSTTTLYQLKPASYSIRIALDENKNKAWDPVNFKLKKQPEPIIDYPEPVKVKSNWEQTIELNLSN